MTADRSSQRNRFLVVIIAIVVVVLGLYVFYHWIEPILSKSLNASMGARAAEDSLIKIPQLILWSLLAFLGVRALSTLIFDLLFRIRRGHEAPTLIRNIFSLVVFTALFVLIF